MTNEAKRVRAAYMREWRKKNPDKTRAYKEKQWEKLAEAKAAKAAAASEEKPTENAQI